MARPRMDSKEIPVKQRIEIAFWDLIKQHPIDAITVGMIVSRAECSRGSFYYHFKDTDYLIDKIIEQNFPKVVPRALYDWFFASHDTFPEFSNDSCLREKLDRFCYLVGPHSSLDIVAKVRKEFISAWFELFGVNEDSIPLEAQIVLEFMSAGVIGILSYRAYHDMDLGVEHYFNAVYPEIPAAFLQRLSLVMKDFDTNT